MIPGETTSGSGPPEESEQAETGPACPGLPGYPSHGDDLPPSARWYGMPVPPPPRRTGNRLRRLLLGSLALAVCGGIVAGAVVLVLRVLPSRLAPRPAV